MSRNSLGPDFIGIGAMKSASGWIFKSLRQHPEVSDKNMKEQYFFNKPYNYRKGINSYYSIFIKSPKGKIKGEFTPSYMLSPQVPQLIHKHLPNVKIIACLRNPAERAYSDYRYNLQEKGRFKLYKDFEDVIKNDKDFVDRGLYFKQLKEYFELFPRENILILFHEDLKKDPTEFIQGIYKFLGLKDTNFIPPLANRKLSITGSYIIKYKFPLINSLTYWLNLRLGNESKLKRTIDKIGIERYLIKLKYYNRTKIIGKNEKVFSVPSFKQSTRGYLLNQVYNDDIHELQNLLHKDLSFWK